MKKWTAGLIAIALAGIAVYAVVWGVPAMRHMLKLRRHVVEAAAREPMTRAKWAMEFGDPDRLLAAFPKQEDSPAALRLVELARDAGIEMARLEGGKRAGAPDPEKPLRDAIMSYAHEELAKMGGPVTEPPAMVRDHLKDRTAGIEAVIGHLDAADPVWWRSDLSLGLEAPVPNLLWNIQLQRLLVADALYRAHLYQFADAERRLRASWALNESLRHRGEVISQMIALSVARMQVGLARRLPVEPSVWRPRFAGADDRALTLRAMVVESNAGARFFSGESDWARASRSDYLDRKMAVLLRFRDSPVSDGPVPDVGPVDDDEVYTVGAIVSGFSWANDASLLHRVDRLIVDRELTDRILAAREQKTRIGRWPSEMSSLEPSRLSGGHWVYAVGADGSMSISFSRGLRWDATGLILPTRYESN